MSARPINRWPPAATELCGAYAYSGASMQSGELRWTVSRPASERRAGPRFGTLQSMLAGPAWPRPDGREIVLYDGRLRRQRFVSETSRIRIMSLAKRCESALSRRCLLAGRATIGSTSGRRGQQPALASAPAVHSPVEPPVSRAPAAGPSTVADASGRRDRLSSRKLLRPTADRGHAVAKRGDSGLHGGCGEGEQRRDAAAASGGATELRWARTRGTCRRLRIRKVRCAWCSSSTTSSIRTATRERWRACSTRCTSASAGRKSIPFSA